MKVVKALKAQRKPTGLAFIYYLPNLYYELLCLLPSIYLAPWWALIALFPYKAFSRVVSSPLTQSNYR